MTCVGEQRLEARVSRRAGRARIKDVGRVDLRFAGSNGWRLAVELKQNSPFGPHQLDGYTEWGPVAAIVRDTSQLPSLKDRTNWVGAASWASMLGDLRALPVDSRWSDHWLALLEVMDSDGEFDVSVPTSRETTKQAELFEQLAQPLVDHLASELHHVYKARADRAVQRLRHSRVLQGGAWAGVGIDGFDGPWLWVAVRNLWSPAPRLRIDYYTFPDWRAKRRLGDAHARIVLDHDFEQRRDYFRFEKPITRLAGASTGEAAAIIGEVISTLVRSRVFDVEIDRAIRQAR